MIRAIGGMEVVTVTAVVVFACYLLWKRKSKLVDQQISLSPSASAAGLSTLMPSHIATPQVQTNDLVSPRSARRLRSGSMDEVGKRSPSAKESPHTRLKQQDS